MLRSVGLLNTALIALAPIGGVVGNSPEVGAFSDSVCFDSGTIDFIGYRHFVFGEIVDFGFPSVTQVSFVCRQDELFMDYANVVVDLNVFDSDGYCFFLFGDFIGFEQDPLISPHYSCICFEVNDSVYSDYLPVDSCAPYDGFFDVVCIKKSNGVAFISSFTSFLLDYLGYSSATPIPSPSDSFFGTFTDALGGVVGTIGSGIGSAVGSLFIEDGKLSTFGYVMATFGGVSLALGLGAVGFKLVSTIGRRKDE